MFFFQASRSQQLFLTVVYKHGLNVETGKEPLIRMILLKQVERVKQVMNATRVYRTWPFHEARELVVGDELTDLGDVACSRLSRKQPIWRQERSMNT